MRLSFPGFRILWFIALSKGTREEFGRQLRIMNRNVRNGIFRELFDEYWRSTLVDFNSLIIDIIGYLTYIAGGGDATFLRQLP